MTDRERLIELFLQPMNVADFYDKEMIAKAYADRTLADGWIRPPCKVGDTVYFVNRFFANDPRINECEVDALHITSGKNRIGHKKPSHVLVRDINMHSLTSRIYFENFGITAFLTCEEAEKALKERETE